jgi:tripartite-type tricarboxylate transporter receptor subunit TctC
MTRLMVHVLHAALIATIPTIACAQNYPSKSIRIVTNAAGGGNDFMARVIAQEISGPLGQAVIIDNRPTGVIQAEVVYKAPPDGYTLLVQGASLWIVTMLQKMPYDVWKDLSPVAQIARDVNIVAVHPSLPAKSIKELIALAKARPGLLNYGSGNPGSPSHLASELFKSMAGVNIVAVPYKSTPQAMTALMSGEVQLTIVDAGLTAPQVKAGRLRALAVTSAEPSPLTPGLPTVAAAGLPGYEAVNMVGVFAPAKTPASVIARLNQEIVHVLSKPDVRQKVFEYGTEATGSTPEDFAGAIKSDMTRLGKVIKDAGIKLD